jgi:hypothetical protein
MPSHKRDKNGRPSDERRCTFAYPGGRRCNEFRAKGHDSLCLYHYQREQKLDPSTSPEAREIVSQVLGTREQFKTATEVNDALAKVFALRGRKLISIRDATLFAYLSQLLLYSIDSVRHEFIQVYEPNEWDKIIERILQLPGATLPPLEPVAPPFRAADSSSSKGGNSAAPKKFERKRKPRPLPATGREFAQTVFTDVAARRAERRERTAARVAQLEKQLQPGEPEQSESEKGEKPHVVYSA